MQYWEFLSAKFWYGKLWRFNMHSSDFSIVKVLRYTVCAFMYVCMCMNIWHVAMCVYVFVCVCTHVGVCGYVCVYVSVCVHAFIQHFPQFYTIASTAAVQLYPTQLCSQKLIDGNTLQHMYSTAFISYNIAGQLY